MSRRSSSYYSGALSACGPAGKSVHIAYCLSLMKTRFMLRIPPHTTVPSRAEQAASRAMHLRKAVGHFLSSNELADLIAAIAGQPPPPHLAVAPGFPCQS